MVPYDVNPVYSLLGLLMLWSDVVRFSCVFCFFLSLSVAVAVRLLLVLLLLLLLLILLLLLAANLRLCYTSGGGYAQEAGRGIRKLSEE